MLAYTATKQAFSDDVRFNRIEQKILESMGRVYRADSINSEVRAWQNSMQYVRNILDDELIPDDCGVAIEFKIPLSQKRVDFILTGKNEQLQKTAIIIELKQWDSAELTGIDGYVKTLIGGAVRETVHPSYQAWSYATMIRDFNSAVEDENIDLKPIAYLHNMVEGSVILDNFYHEYIEEAPVFLRHDAERLQNFIKAHVKYGDAKRGDTTEILYEIENGKIRPSKHLADRVASLLAGNREFVLIDNQKLVYETALKLAQEATDEVHNVLVVEGGPGTGKSVVAINLLVELLKRGLTTKYITSNSAPREVFKEKLKNSKTKAQIDHLFSGTGSFYDTPPNTFDALVVDEAHRLKKKSGMFDHLGENQTKEIIHSAKFSVFFIDEDQRVTFADSGSKEDIYKYASEIGANIENLVLESQFRMNGSDGYLAWLDNTLGIRDTANIVLDKEEYDFQVIDTPDELHEIIIEKNKKNNKSRMLAGYCWKWVSKKDKSKHDIFIGDTYSAKWNLEEHGQGWIINPESVSEVGCVYTSQGLELDYVGVIVGDDFKVRNNEIIIDVDAHASGDKAIKGYKTRIKSDPVNTKILADRIIKNTYRTLMSRGMKGCYLYCTDPETQDYFKKAIEVGIDRANFFN